MLSFYKLINFTNYFYLLIHLLIHFIKIKTNRWIITSLNSIETKDLNDFNINGAFKNFLWIVIFWNLGNIVLNFFNRYTNFKIKTFISEKISKYIYLKSIENKETHSLQLFENSLVIDKIYERLLFTIPKILIYVFYYTYLLFSFSYQLLFITIVFNLVCVYITRKFNQIKKNIFNKIYNIEVNLKNEHIKYIKDNTEHDLENLYKLRNKEKENEAYYLHFSSISTELFTDILLGLIYCIGFSYLNPSSINNIKPIELMYMGINSSNFLNFIIDLIDCYHNHSQDLIQLGNLKKYFTN